MMTIPFKSETPAPHGFRTTAARPGSVEFDRLKRDWLEGRDGIVAIAGRHGIRAGALRRLARAEGWPPRRRGRPTDSEPSPQVRRILVDAWQNTYASAGITHGVSKQRVAQIVQRWSAWATGVLGERAVQRAGRPRRIPRIPRVRRGRPKTQVLTFRVDAETARMLEQRRRVDTGVVARSMHGVARQLVLLQLHGGVETAS